MAEPFIGQINMFGFDFPPRNYALCNGSLISISSNNALFALLGTHYGGDGRTTFGLPNLQGRSPMHYGTGIGLMPKNIGQAGGYEQFHITESSMPPHIHEATFAPNGAASLKASETEASSDTPAAGSFLAKANMNGRGVNMYVPAGSEETTVDLGGIHGITGGTIQVGQTGGGNPVPTQSPYLAINFSIALTGLFPSRN